MILDTLAQAERCYSQHPLFRQLFEYVQSHNLCDAPTGRITLDGDNLFINVCDATLHSKEEQKLEVHREYIDIHFPLSGEEVCGWTPLSSLSESDEPFNEESDFAVYSQAAQTYFCVEPGQFYIVWPEDAHAPIIRPENAESPAPLRKLVAKVRIVAQ